MVNIIKSSIKRSSKSMMIMMKISQRNNQDRLIPKRGKVKVGIALAVAHTLVSLFSVDHHRVIKVGSSYH
ncbi:hypothetical protein RND81_06G117000 [Saponaria officinalis]|uniref:Uncharacterized protein n=1 Tax=Saponaria officinalis TaxID=3572 RepID=A0AAW1KAM2_SAPOF